MSVSWNAGFIQLSVCSEFSGTIDAATHDVGDLLRVSGNTMSDVALDQKLTVFAPVDEAFSDNDFAQDSHTKGLVCTVHCTVDL